MNQKCEPSHRKPWHRYTRSVIGMLFTVTIFPVALIFVCLIALLIVGLGSLLDFFNVLWEWTQTALLDPEPSSPSKQQTHTTSSTSSQ